MRILVLADIHGDVDRLSRILARAGEPDLVLVAGDLTDFGEAEQLRRVLDALGGLADRTLAVPGNCDKRSARELLESSGLSVDGRSVDRAGALVAGVGGAPLRTGLTPYERHDAELSSSLRAALAAEPRGGRPLVVLSHAPPRDSGADLRRDSCAGSRELRALLDGAAPTLWACGHIHESPSARSLGSCLVLNPGAVRDGRYALAELERSSSDLWVARAELL